MLLTVHGLLVTMLMVVLIVLLIMGAWRYVSIMRLNRKLRRYRAFVDNSNDLIVVLDRDGVVRFASPASNAILGGPPEQLVGRHLTDFVHPDHHELVAAQWARTLSEPNAPIETEVRIIRLDGSTGFIHATGRNLLHDEAIRGVLAHVQDITERRAALDALRATEEQFRKAQKMEAVGRLAGGVAHDFNNLLTAIQGYTRLLLEDLPADNAMRMDLEQVQQGAERAAALTRQLLAFSRRQLLQPKTLELNRIVASFHETAGRMLGPDIELELDLARDTGMVRADPSQLTQALTNLLDNARDAMPRGGRVTIRTRPTLITDDEAASYPYPVVPGDYAELTVSDNGLGIDPDVMSQIFEPFFTTKDPGKGTGLGLAMVYGIVKQSSGYIWVSTEVNGGAHFRICLPRVMPVAEDAAAREALTEARAQGGTILVVEDEEAVRRLAQRILQRAGYNIIVAHDGNAALDIARGYSGPIDLVITDVVMPGLTGPEVVEQLISLRPQTKALFVSGYTRDAIMEGGFISPGVAFLEKPFAPDALTAKVREVLDGG